jgi:hypothetical protein
LVLASWFGMGYQWWLDCADDQLIATAVNIINREG